jgi:hypothetical protein
MKEVGGRKWEEGRWDERGKLKEVGPRDEGKSFTKTKKGLRIKFLIPDGFNHVWMGSQFTSHFGFTNEFPTKVRS